jgi:hypothetical protein
MIYGNLDKLEELFREKRNEVIKSALRLAATPPPLEPDSLDVEWASYLNKIGCEVVEGADSLVEKWNLSEKIDSVCIHGHEYGFYIFVPNELAEKALALNGLP